MSKKNKKESKHKDVLFTWNAPTNFTGTVRFPGNIIKSFKDGVVQYVEYGDGTKIVFNDSKQ